MHLAHLEQLHDVIDTPAGENLHYWWIYAGPTADRGERPPPDAEYVPFHASREGITCVDDVARVAVVYLTHHRVEGDDHSRERARQALEFVRYMQREDGRFLNFVTDPEMNETVFGESDPDVVEGVRVDGTLTSYPSAGWWGARACWALGEGYRTFVDTDPAFAAELRECLRDYLGAIAGSVLGNYGEYMEMRGKQIPTWLIQDSSYITAPAMLGLASYYRASGDEFAEVVLRSLADGIQASQHGDTIEPPYGAHLSLRPGKCWHAWGLRQGAALARAGDVLDEDAYVDSARREVASLHSHHLASHVQIGSFGPTPLPPHQLAYGTDALVHGCTELWRATDEPGFARLGSQIASWYAGNNLQGARMWEPEADRGYDGIYKDAVDWKAGAESTIAAARSMLDVEQYPPSARDHRHSEVHASRTFTVIEAEEGTFDRKATGLNTNVRGPLISGGQVAKIFDGGRMVFDPDLEPGMYRPYIVVAGVIAPDATVSMSIGDQQRTLDIGGEPERTYRMTALDPVEIAGSEPVAVEYEGARDRAARIDALVFQPVVEYRVAGRGQESAIAAARSFADEARTVSIPTPVDGRCTVAAQSFDATGTVVNERRETQDSAENLALRVESRGFSLVSVARADTSDT